ncbi:MAG: RluA family pseudouridine synthase [Methylobacteriaceae bacterium]|nr:RluA family pseudouridine synthase [Methylobacteriaceae bacterium]
MRHAFTLAAGGERLDRALAAEAGTAALGLSRSRLKALIEAGHVEVDGVVCVDPAAKCAAGARVEVDLPPPAPATPAAQAIALDIVHEDDELIVLDKPAGLVVHPAAGHADGTLVNALIAHCGATLSGIGGVARPGIVHRLDKDTSGLLVIAKTDRAHQGLAAQFADHGREGPLEREYLALVWGAPARPAGVIEAPVGRHPRHREKMAVVAPGRGRAAITHWRVLARFGDPADPVASLVACRLETGRTHQIRVHMASIGHPVMGDPLYATGFRTRAARLTADAQAALAALGRQALHAARLGFAHPATGETLRFERPPPADFARLLAALSSSSFKKNK